MSPVKPESALRTLIQLDPRACFIYNLDSRSIAYANPAFYTFFQSKPESVKAERLQKMINKEDRTRVEKTFCALVAGSLQLLEFGLKLPNGDLHVVEIALALEQQEDCRLVTGYLRDITEEKRNAAAALEMRAANELRRRTLRHDIAGTLGFIPTFTNLLLKKSVKLEDPQIAVLLSSIDSISKETLTKIKEYMSEETS